MGADLAPYVPRLLLDWQEEAPEARYRAIEGTLVFTDLSGFTAMSERLAKLGKLGAEELVEHLDAVFTELLDVAGDLGGSLVKFGGDALLIFFWGEDHARRGCRAAWDMQTTLRRVGRIQTSAGRVVLRMSVGIHSGVFDFFLVGDSHRELYITGPEATTTVHMESAADAREVLVSPATAAVLEGRALGDPKGPGVLLRRRPALDAAGGEWFREWPRELDPEQFVPASLRRQLTEGGHEPEHRQITAFFVHASDVDAVLADHGPEEAADRLQALTGSVQRHLAEHGVTFLATDVYHDGPKILGCAGAPVSWGNDEERVLRALRAVVDDDHGVELRVGINRGHAFSGEVGPSFRRTYVAMGDVVNTAARVCAKAGPGEILATGAVLDRSVTVFDTEELPPFPAKGKALPLVAHRVGAILGSQRSDGHVRLPLFGRERELARLRGAFDDARQGLGRVVEVVGEPGIGKSRLVDELHAQLDEVPFHVTVCEQYEASTPYHPFRALLGSVLGERSASALAAFVDRRAPELRPWLPLLAIPLDVTVEPTPEVERLDPEFVQGRLHEVVAALVAAMVDEPTIWLVDDAHWMDEASAALLAHLASHAAEWPLLLAVSRRPGETGVRLEDDDAVRIDLQPLSADDAARIAQAASDRSLLPQQAALLAARGGGNPLFLRELAASTSSADDVDHLPDTVEALVGARIDRLPPAERLLLRQVSVLGMRFDAPTARSVAEDVADDVWSGGLRQFVERHGHELRFRHALVRDVAYEGLSYRARRTLHRRAGELIEARTPDPEQEAELLSLHFHQAKDWERSWRYSQAAARRAEEKYAYLEAAQFWRRAAEVGRRVDGVDDLALARMWQSAGEALRRGGAFLRVGSAYRQARRLGRDCPELVVELCQLEGNLQNLRGRSDQARRWYRRGLSLLGTHPEGQLRELLRARLCEGQADLFYEQGVLDRSVHACEEGLTAADRAGDLGQSARLLSILHVALRDLRSSQREEVGRRALELALATGQQRLAANVYGNLGVDAHLDGDWRGAVELYRRALHAKETTGHVVAAAIEANNLAEILSDQGVLDEAEPLFERAASTFEAAGFWYLFPVLRNLGRLRARLGALDEASTLLARAQEGLARVGAQEQVLETDLRLAEVELWRGEVQRSAERLQKLPTGAPVFLRPLFHRLRAHVLLRLGEIEQGATALDASVDSARQAGDQFGLLLARRAQRELAEVMGEPHPSAGEEEARLVARLGVVAVVELPVALGGGRRSR